MGEYEFDIFVSYKRERDDEQLVTPWLDRVLQLVFFWVGQELQGREVVPFRDTTSIPLGAQWPAELRRGILKSRCLFAVWSPEYFRAPWCVAEWRSFYEREKLLVPAGNRLIVPVKFHDGQWFPPEAQNTQTYDLSQLTGTTPAFWETRRADTLDLAIKNDIAPAIARVIENAPPECDEHWPLVDPTPPPAPPPIDKPEWS